MGQEVVVQRRSTPRVSGSQECLGNLKILFGLKILGFLKTQQKQHKFNSANILRLIEILSLDVSKGLFVKQKNNE